MPHWVWIIIIVFERAALVNILIDYALEMDAHVVAFNAGGKGAEEFMNALRKDQLAVHIIRGVHLTCYTGKPKLVFAFYLRQANN